MTLCARKTVTKRLEAIGGLRTSIGPLAPAVVRRLAGRPAAPDGAGTGYELVFEHMHAELLALEHRLRAAEDAYIAEKARFKELKQHRDQARTDLGCRHRRIHGLLAGFFPREHLARLGIARTVPPSALVFVRQVTSTIHALREIEILGPPIVEVTFDAPAIAGDLEVDLGHLETAVADLEAARASTVFARGRADDAVAEVDRTAPSIGDCIMSLCQLADERLAKRVRRR